MNLAIVYWNGKIVERKYTAKALLKLIDKKYESKIRCICNAETGEVIFANT